MQNTEDRRDPDAVSISPDLMSLEELRRRMDISRTAAYELARGDRLPVPTFRVGRQFRFSRKAFEALLVAQHGPDVESV